MFAMNLILTENSRSLEALSTLRRRHLKTVLSLWKRIKLISFPFTKRRRNQLENAKISGCFGVVLEEISGREITCLSLCHRFRKASLQNVSRPHLNAKPAFSNSSGLKSVFEKLCFRDGLMWTVGLTEKRKQRFQIFRTWRGGGPYFTCRRNYFPFSN